ncbi:MAG: DUF3570 domain-containing protein [Saprospiraceae bacterium]
MIQKKYFLFFLILGFNHFIFSQSDEYKMKANSKEVEIDFLSGYYQQDGNNGAVTGGVGTEELTDISNIIVVKIPLDSINSISISGGADYYTSASTDNIDNNVSSASRKDVRAYTNLTYQRKNLAKSQTLGAKLGFSAEYDYTSFSGGLSYAKEFDEGNRELSINGQVFIDNWSIIYPKELRGEVSLPTSGRQSYNLQIGYAQVINKRLQMLVSLDAIYMKGLLSTPFHRVYFADQNMPDIERLPSSRLKLPVGIRLNYFPFDNFVVRSYYRFYWDDFGIQAHTMSLETPIKLGETITISPFYRYNTQTSADYFAPFEVHSSTDAFYTSDYDLSDLSSHKFGMGFKYSPVYGIGRAKLPFTKKLFMFKSAEIRSAYYKRSTGLNAFIVSLGLSFGIK